MIKQPQDIRIPICTNKDYAAPSIFTPELLLQGAQRQKSLDTKSVPDICILDPDGDVVDYLRSQGRSQRHPGWACYHSQLDTFLHAGVQYGIVGRTVGASFAVMVAEELFASGCQLLINISSAGQITPLAPPPYVVLIEKALRDEGTSYHYLPPSPYSFLHPALHELLCSCWNHNQIPLYSGASWTTDAPFRETEALIAQHRAEGILTVEMEAAALYALATAKKQTVICFALVTNRLGQHEQDFEKGIEQGSLTVLQIIHQVTRIWQEL